MDTCVSYLRHRFPKVFHALGVAEQYKMMDESVEGLLQVVTKLAKKWLNDGYEKEVKIEARLPDLDEEHP